MNYLNGILIAVFSVMLLSTGVATTYLNDTSVQTNLTKTNKITSLSGAIEFLEEVQLSSNLDVGGNDVFNAANVNSTNFYATDVVNSTNVTAYNVTADYFKGDGSQLINLPDSWVNETGDSMTGNLDLGGNDVFNAANVNVTGTGSVSVTGTGDVDATGNVTAGEFLKGKRKACTAQFYRNDSVDTTTTATWENVSWDTPVSDVTSCSFTRTNGNETIEVGQPGVYMVSGSINGHYHNTTRIVGLASRVTVNNAAKGKRGTQSYTYRSMDDGDYFVHPYSGTMKLDEGYNVSVEFKVTNSSLDLNGSTTFDDPIAADIQLYKISD